MPEYREAYLNSLEQKQNKGSEESASTEIAKQEVQNTTEQAVTQQIEESEMSGQSHSEAITQEEQGQQTVQSDRHPYQRKRLERTVLLLGIERHG